MIEAGLRRALLVLPVLLVLLAGCDASDRQVLDGADSGAASPADRRAAMRERLRSRPVPVAVSRVERGRVDAFYSSTTSLTAEEEAVVVARTQGIVEHIYVEEGDRVAEGEPLAQLDTETLALEVAKTKTNVEALQRAFERASQLYEKKMISPDAFDKAKFDLEREQANLALQVHDLKEATIRAPIDGVITVRHIKLGNTLAPNQAAFEIKRADRVEAILNVPEKEMSKLEEGQYAVVNVDALKDRRFEGVVDRVAPQVDPDSGTFRVTVLLDNPDGTLKPGMFARVRIRYDSNENTLLVSRDAVVTDKDQKSVFVVENGVALRHPVVVGYAMESEIEILDGVGEGDEVVVSGQGGLRDGAAVRIVHL